MRLLELRLQNFRQHADTEISFQPGLTGIIGPNGAGKSTLLEAIAWAIYGSEAARGTNETIRFARAGSTAPVRVELRFELGGHEYQVVRTLRNAEAYLDGGAAPVAATLGGVTRYLQGRLGMNRREFFNTYFTGQKELQVLNTMGPAERGRFLSQVLGYERLRQAQELARERRNELRHEIEGLRAGMRGQEEIREEREAAERQLLQAQAALATAETQRAAAAATLAELAPRWAEAQTARERHRELSHAVETAEREREAARRDWERVEGELARVAQAEAELATLREQLAPLPGVADECARLGELARLSERRRALTEQAAEMQRELARSAERLTRVEQAPALVQKFAAELAALRGERAQVETQREERNSAWLQDRQDARTKLQAYRDRAPELREQVRQIGDLGPAGICPTCQRSLGDNYESLLAQLEDELALLEQDEKWWISRERQLREKPPELAQLERRIAELDAAVDDRARKHTRCEAAVQELKQVQEDQGQREQRLAELHAELARIPADYDPARHREAEARLQQLRALETRAARLEEAASRRARLERDRGEARERELAAASRAAAAVEERRALGFAEEAYLALNARYDAAGEQVHQSELRSTELRGRLRTAEQMRAAAERAEEQYLERMREIALREDELRLHNELDAAFSELRGELNAQVRPELSEIASTFLAQLTDGRYTAMEINESYDLLVLDEGEEKPVISGGEEDIANLVLRLSLSQMIAERAGHPLSLLILDEVFASLDVARRDNVVQLLRHLEDRFDQVLLITHVEGIRESLDQVLRVSFDERTGSSIVREENLVGSDDVLAGVAAD